jgi:GNAT superfamily N-acetyltransferase
MGYTAKELATHEFTEQFAPIIQHVATEARQGFNADFFFPCWRKLMEQKTARTWEIPGAILGSLFYPHVYTGEMRAVIMFWFALPSARGTGRPMKLLDAFEDAAKGLHKSCAAYAALTPERLRKILRKRGYELSEEIWSKV